MPQQQQQQPGHVVVTVEFQEDGDTEVDKAEKKKQSAAIEGKARDDDEIKRKVEDDVTLKELAVEIQSIWDEAAREQDQRLAADKKASSSSSGLPVSLSYSVGRHRHTILLVDCGPSMMMKAMDDQYRPARSTASTSAVNGPLHHPQQQRLPESCGFLKALRACEAIVKAHVRDVAFGGNSRGAGGASMGRSLRDAISIVLYNTRIRTPVEWDTYQKTTSSPVKKKKGRPKRDDDDNESSSSEDEDDDDNDNDEDGDFLAFAKMPSRTHDFIPLELPGGSTVQRIREALHGTIDLVELYGHTQQPGEINSNLTTPTTTNAFTDNDKDAHGHLDEAMIAVTSTAKSYLRNQSTHKNDEVHVWVLTNNSFPCRPDNLPAFYSSIVDSMRLCRGVVTIWPMGDDPLDAYRLDDHTDENASSLLRVMDPTSDEEELVEYMVHEWARPPPAVSRPKWRRIPLIRPDWKRFCNNSSSSGSNGTTNNSSGNNHDDAPSGIMLDWFDVVAGRATLPREKEVHAYSGVPISSETHYLAEGGGPILAVKSGTKTRHGVPPDRMCTYVNFVDTQVPITPLDRHRVLAGSTSCPYASLTLWGFKDADQLPFYMNIDKPLFVFPSPDEENANGARAFASLRDSMIRKGVVMIGELVPRPGAMSRLVALSPWEPLPGVALQPPPGMLARLLPYKEELRDTSLPPTVKGKLPAVPDERLFARMNRLVTKLSYVGEDMPVIGEDFTNARLDRLQNYIERVAMCDPEPPDGGEVDYDTSVTSATKEKRRAKLSGIIARLKEALPEDDILVETIASPKISRKRPRVVEEVFLDDDSDWISRYVAFDYDITKFKVDELKAYCKEVGLKQAGKKAEIGARVKAHMETSIAANGMGS